MLSGLIFYMTDMGQLVDHARQGDSRAQATLYRLCRTKAVKACHRIVGDLPLSEELADDAFIVAFGKLHQLEDNRRFEPWLCQIARRLALRHLSRCHELATAAERGGNTQCRRQPAARLPRGVPHVGDRRHVPS